VFVSYTYDAYVGIAHPSRVYNIRALGIPYLYIGPRESPVQELGPPFSVRHGDVDGVVRAIETSAQSDARWRAVACEVSDHARDWVDRTDGDGVRNGRLVPTACSAAPCEPATSDFDQQTSSLTGLPTGLQVRKISVN